MSKRPFFVMPLELVNVTGPAQAGHPASHLARLKAMSLVWRNDGGGTITGQFTSEQAVDFVAVLGSNAKPATTLRVQIGAYDSGVQPFIKPAISRWDAIYHSHTELPAPQTVSSWSITVGHSGVFEAAIIVIGLRLEPSKFYDYGHQDGIQDSGSAEMTRSGVWNGQDGAIARVKDLTLNWHSEAEYETKFRPLIEQVGTTQPLFLAFDPQEGPYRQNRTYYGRFEKSPVVSARRKPGVYGADYRVFSHI